MWGPSAIRHLPASPEDRGKTPLSRRPLRARRVPVMDPRGCLLLSTPKKSRLRSRRAEACYHSSSRRVPAWDGERRTIRERESQCLSHGPSHTRSSRARHEAPPPAASPPRRRQRHTTSVDGRRHDGVSVAVSETPLRGQHGTASTPTFFNNVRHLRGRSQLEARALHFRRVVRRVLLEELCEKSRWFLKKCLVDSRREASLERSIVPTKMETRPRGAHLCETESLARAGATESVVQTGSRGKVLHALHRFFRERLQRSIATRFGASSHSASKALRKERTQTGCVYRVRACTVGPFENEPPDHKARLYAASAPSSGNTRCTSRKGAILCVKSCLRGSCITFAAIVPHARFRRSKF